MTASNPTLEKGVRIRVPGDTEFATVDFAQFTDSGCLIYAETSTGIRKFALTNEQLQQIEVLRQDGGAQPELVLAGLWAQWMRAATLEAKATALATTPLRPYAHQTNAVYGAMLPQPLLRFLLADEPGTGKTIMAGMYLREMQRLGFVRRALIICPAHLVEKWRADFERFFGGGLRRISAGTVREGALEIKHDLWITSMDLAAVNAAVQEAIRPDRAGWDAIVIDEAHRMTLSAQAYYHLGRLMSRGPRVLLMTATPHRGKEHLFRALLHLVDPTVFPSVEEGDAAGRQLKPGSVHFLRRMKEDLVDYDGITPLFKGRRAQNLPVALNASEQAFYDQAIEMVDRYFPPNAVTLAKMVYGKRAASSLYALRETLKRRHDGMGTDSPTNAVMVFDPEGEDEAERDLAKVVVEQSLAARAERREINAMLGQLDAVLAQKDLAVSKWPRILDNCLATNGIKPGGTEQAVVFTEFADTADWLVERFRDAGFTAERYSGRDLNFDREDVRRRFAAREFQIIVSTDAGNEGIDLQTAHVLVNWDIPWSLVRLEQRMGRIHRVGQARAVELYNLVATGTREGDVLERLLSNFVIAANQLDGKMFDSLSLMAELVNLDFEGTLAKTYQSAERAKAAAATAAAATAEHLAAAARRAANGEDALRSMVDVAQAVSALQEESLERINPQIVEAFLRRMASATLLELNAHAAGNGVFMLAPSARAELAIAAGIEAPILVATSGAALEDAQFAGADVSGATTLGPGEDAFRKVVNAGAEATRWQLFEGGQLRDPTSITDYVLFVYEADIAEFGGQRRSTLPFLVRADATGARRVRWERLANLEAGDQEPIAMHPSRSQDAALAAAGVTANEEQRRRRVLEDWVARAQIELDRLPSALTSHIDDAAVRVAERKRVDAAIAQRIDELREMSGVKVGEPRLIGWAAVSGSGVPVSATEADSEEIAMVHVAELLRSSGWSVADVHLEGRGYDLLARKGREQRSIEVKGVWESASSRGIRMTGHELLIARQLAEDYWLYVVDRCQESGGTLLGAYQNPVDRFQELMRDLTVVAVPGSALASAAGEHAPT